VPSSSVTVPILANVVAIGFTSGALSARVGPKIGARFLGQRRILFEEEAAQRLLVCESGGRRPTFGSIAVACIERGRHGTSLAGVTTRSDGANMKEHSGDVTRG
jgi:hypothetical protein